MLRGRFAYQLTDTPQEALGRLMTATTMYREMGELA